MRTVTIDGLPIGDGHPPRVMSVLNMSSESNYEPSVYTDPQRAAEFVDEELVPAGGDIIDIGLQSANPKYDTKPVEFELDRLAEVANVLDYVESDVPFSLETRYAAVAEEAIGHGFHVINDVCGFADPDMKGVIEDHDMPVIKMASPPDLNRPGALKTIDDVFDAIQRHGFTDRTIIDPAFGGWYDGKTHEDNWEMFRRLREFRAFGRPIVTATNREDFLGDLAGKPETENQLAVSLAAATMEVERGAHIIRTHDTEATHDVVKVAHTLGDDRITRTESPTVAELRNVDYREARRHENLSRSQTRSLTESIPTSLLIGDLRESARAEIIEMSENTDVVVLDREDGGVFLSGTPPELRAFTEKLSGEPGGLDEISTQIQKVLDRGI